MTSTGSNAPTDGKTITEHELEQCERANQIGRQPVVFVHGLWLLPSSWDRWAKMPGRGHALIIDSGWRAVADTALAFVQRFVKS